MVLGTHGEARASRLRKSSTHAERLSHIGSLSVCRHVRAVTRRPASAGHPPPTHWPVPGSRRFEGRSRVVDNTPLPPLAQSRAVRNRALGSSGTTRINTASNDTRSTTRVWILQSFSFCLPFLLQACSRQLALAVSGFVGGVPSRCRGNKS